jgi:predicted RNA-binding protein with PUA-like domain
MSFWLVKTEPDMFSWDDLVNSKGQTAPWDGVRNYQARNFMRDQFRLNDKVFFYHSRVENPGIVGIAEVVRESYPDHTALDPKSKYSDEKSIRDGVSRWVMVDLKAVQALPHPVSLSELKLTSELKDMLLVQPGQRLSVQPVSEVHWRIICKMGGL